MEEKIDIKRRKFAYFLLIFSTIFLYVSLTGAKNLYSSEKTTLYELGIFGNFTDLATTMEYYFYTYAAMQIFLIFFVKKINIKWFLTATLGISALLIGAVPFTENITQHYVLYAINGVLQAGIWGCLLKVLSMHLPSRLLPIANQIMSAGPAVSGAVGYGVAAAFSENWKLPFILMSLLLLAAVAIYCISVTYIERFPKEIEMHHVVHSDGTEEDVSDDDENDFIHLDSKKRVIMFYALSTLLSLLFTTLYFSVSNNLDVYLKEIGGFSNDKSKLLTILAPVFAVVGPFICVRMCEAHKNFIGVCTVFFGAAMAVSLLLVFLFDKNTAVSLALVVLFIVLVNGGRSITLSIAALRMRSKIDTGVYSTMVNAAASVASGFAPKIITMVLDNTSYGTQESWKISFIIILLFSVVTVALLIASMLLVKLANRNRTANT